MSIRTNSHSHEWLRRFSEVIQEFPEVVEFYRMSGDVDYLLRVVVKDIQGYDAVYRRLIRSCELYDVNSSFAMERIKYSTALPVAAPDEAAAPASRKLVRGGEKKRVRRRRTAPAG